MAAGGAGVATQTWWKIQIFVGDAVGVLRSFHDQRVFEALSLLGVFCAAWAAWKVAKADWIDTRLLNEAESELKKAKKKQVTASQERLARLTTGRKSPSRRISASISNIFTLAIAAYAISTGKKGDYDAGLAKQFATLKQKRRSQNLKARARILGAVSLVCVGGANLVKPDPLTPSEKVALQKLTSGRQ
jgi:hypothetical protein